MGGVEGGRVCTNGCECVVYMGVYFAKDVGMSRVYIEVTPRVQVSSYHPSH